MADSTLRGLRLRVSAAGMKSWSLACRDPLGRMRRFPLGQHPKMGVAEAREAARAMRPAVRDVDPDKRFDPVAAARRERAVGKDARAGIGTLAALIDLYGKKCGAELKSWPESKRRIESVFAGQLKNPVKTMKRGDLQLAVDGWPSGHSAAAAVRYIRPILKWASNGGREYAAPELANLALPVTVGRRDRILTRNELGRVLPVLKSSPRPYASCMLFLILTLARREEAGAAKWGDIDFVARTWKIPTTKNGQPHVVPLSDQAAALLRGLQPRNASGDIIEKPGALIFATGTGRRLGNWDKESKSLMKKSQTAGWTRHDLRRTAATLLGEMGEPPHVVEAALNHVSVHSQLAATYNQSRYRREVAAALQRLADNLDRIEAEAGKVPPGATGDSRPDGRICPDR